MTDSHKHPLLVSRRFLWLTMLLPLAGCSQGEGAKIIGDWQITNVESVSERVVSDEPTAEETEAKMSAQFHSSGKLTTRTRISSIDSVKTGTWEFRSFDEAAGVMRVQCILDGQATDHQIEFLDSATINWIPPNMAGTENRLTYKRSTLESEK